MRLIYSGGVKPVPPTPIPWPYLPSSGFSKGSFHSNGAALPLGTVIEVPELLIKVARDSNVIPFLSSFLCLSFSFSFF
jgi:hypothetical protein